MEALIITPSPFCRLNREIRETSIINRVSIVMGSKKILTHYHTNARTATRFSPSDMRHAKRQSRQRMKMNGRSQKMTKNTNYLQEYELSLRIRVILVWGRYGVYAPVLNQNMG